MALYPLHALATCSMKRNGIQKAQISGHELALSFRLTPKLLQIVEVKILQIAPIFGGRLPGPYLRRSVSVGSDVSFVRVQGLVCPGV